MSNKPTLEREPLFPPGFIACAFCVFVVLVIAAIGMWLDGVFYG